MTLFENGHALIIGAGGDLPNTVTDAQGVTDILRDSDRCAYRADHVHVLTGPSAERPAILTALDTLAQTTNEQSTVILYFSGHGYRVSSSFSDAYFLLPYGYDLKRLKQTAISGAEFTQKLQAISAQKLLVLLDCCHAGGIGEAKAGQSPVAGIDMISKAPLPPEAVTLFTKGSGRVLIASSKEDELSYAGKPYSAFTLALIEALSGVDVAKQDGYVRISDVALHARQVVPSRTKGKQHPTLHFEHADNFVLSYYAGGDTQPKGVPFDMKPEIEPEPGAWRGINQSDVTIHGSQTNIAGDIKLSGHFNGLVALNSGDAVDFRGAQSIIEQPTGPINQHFGDRIQMTGDGNVVGGSHHQVTVIGQGTGGQVTLERFLQQLRLLHRVITEAKLDAETTQVLQSDLEVVEHQARAPQPRGTLLLHRLKGVAEILATANGAVRMLARAQHLAQQLLIWAEQLFK